GSDSHHASPEGMVWIPAGTFEMGSNANAPDERPVHPVHVDGFWMDKTEVTNAEFAKFVKATGYVTTAERPLDPADYPGVNPAMLQPAGMVFTRTHRPVPLNNPGRWWRLVPGAN